MKQPVKAWAIVKDDEFIKAVMFYRPVCNKAIGESVVEVLITPITKKTHRA